MAIDIPKYKSGFKTLMAELYLDDEKFCKTFFPHLFTTPFTPIHQGLLNTGKERTERRFRVRMAPRGIGKTTTMKFGKVAKSILFREKRHIVYVSNTLDIAEMATEHIKRELLSNEMVLKVFGDISKSINSESSVRDQFGRTAWVAFGSTLIVPRGCGQQIRGMNFEERPDLIVCDDPENRKEIKNETIRAENKRWMLGDVVPALDQYKKKGEIIYVDTLKHHDALPLHLADKKVWDYKSYSLCDVETLESHVPEYMTTDEIKETYREYELTGDLDIFYQEYLNLPNSPLSADFKRSFFKYFEEKDIDHDLRKRLVTVVIMDPAKTTRKESDDTAIIPVSFDFLNHKIFFRDCIASKMHPWEGYQKCLDLARRYKAKIIAVEVAGLNEFIIYPFTNFLEKNQATDIALMELKHGGVPKEDRIRGLSWFYQSGYVYHKKGTCEKLEGQLLSFPNAANDDLSDCAAYAISMLKKGGVYFPHWVRNVGQEALLRENLELEGYDEEEMEPLLEMAAYGDYPMTAGSWEII